MPEPSFATAPNPKPLPATFSKDHGYHPKIVISGFNSHLRILYLKTSSHAYTLVSRQWGVTISGSPWAETHTIKDDRKCRRSIHLPRIRKFITSTQTQPSQLLCNTTPSHAVLGHDPCGDQHRCCLGQCLTHGYSVSTFPSRVATRTQANEN